MFYAAAHLDPGVGSMNGYYVEGQSLMLTSTYGRLTTHTGRCAALEPDVCRRRTYCTDMADENCTLRQAVGSWKDRGAGDVREGAKSAVASLSGAWSEQG